MPAVVASTYSCGEPHEPSIADEPAEFILPSLNPKGPRTQIIGL